MREVADQTRLDLTKVALGGCLDFCVRGVAADLSFRLVRRAPNSRTRGIMRESGGRLWPLPSARSIGPTPSSLFRLLPGAREIREPGGAIGR